MAEVYVGRKFKTKFIKGVREDAGKIDGIISVGRELNTLGLTPENAGNISVRTANGMLITVGGKNKGELKEEDVVEVTFFDGKTAEVIGEKEPSSETPLHWQVYQKFGGINAIIHAHDQEVLKNAVKLRIPSTKHAVGYGTQYQAKQVVEALKYGNYVVIKNHGIVSTGKDLDEALESTLFFHKKSML